MNGRADAIYAGVAPRISRDPVVVVHVNGDELLSRVRTFKMSMRRGLETARKVVKMWYL